MRSKARAPRHRKEPDPLARTIGQRVRALRGECDFTFDAFVEETGLGRGYVSELERGLVVPSAVVLARIAAAFELTMADLVLGETLRERLFELTRRLPGTDVQILLAAANDCAKRLPEIAIAQSAGPAKRFPRGGSSG